MSNNNVQQNAALLVMDVQNGIVAMLDDDNPMMDHLSETVATARGHNIPIIYVRVAFRKGYPEVNPNNKSFSQIKDADRGFDDEKATSIHTSVAPQPGDIVITKKRVSAFTGSDLGVILRSQQINHLILTGIATSGVVLSTLREAADKDYTITVLSDCCADQDEEVHRVLTEKIFPRQADVINSRELESVLRQ